jgi:hypothetical protein
MVKQLKRSSGKNLKKRLLQVLFTLHQLLIIQL